MFLTFKSSIRKCQIKNEKDFVAAFALVDEDILQHHRPCENGNISLDFLFKLPDYRIFCGLAKLDATAKRTNPF